MEYTVIPWAILHLNKKLRAPCQLRQQPRRVAYRNPQSLTVVERFERVGHGVEDVPLGTHSRAALAEVLHEYLLHAVVYLRLRQRRNLARTQ